MTATDGHITDITCSILLGDVNLGEKFWRNHNTCFCKKMTKSHRLLMMNKIRLVFSLNIKQRVHRPLAQFYRKPVLPLVQVIRCSPVSTGGVQVGKMGHAVVEIIQNAISHQKPCSPSHVHYIKLWIYKRFHKVMCFTIQRRNISKDRLNLTTIQSKGRVTVNRVSF
jgi:hypothetical protein